MKFRLFPIAIAGATGSILVAFATVGHVIALGTTDLTGFTTEMGSIDPDALINGIDDAGGDACNKSGKPMTDLTLDIDNGTAGTIEANGLTVTPNERGAANFTFSTPIADGDCISIGFNDLSADDPDTDIELSGTPSFSALVDGQWLEVNMLPTIDLRSSRDLVRTTLAKAYHRGVYARILNSDTTDRINRIDGFLSFPGSGSSILIDVKLQDINGTPQSGVLSIAGNSFSFTGINPIPGGGEAWLVLEFADAIDGEPVRLRVTGTFIP